MPFVGTLPSFRSRIGLTVEAPRLLQRVVMSTLPPACRSVAVLVTLSHRTSYTPDEEISFRHVRHYLGRYDKYVLIPESHQAVYPGLMPKRFPDRFFGSARAHGSLLLSQRFYRAFSDYEFVLLYHLDSLVFSDQLEQWCRAGYDYVGAPWLVSPDMAHVKHPKVGIGGFSLRRVASFLRVLNSRRYFVDPAKYWHEYCARTGPVTRFLNTPRKYLKRMRMFNDIRLHIRWAKRCKTNEDRFYADYATHYDPEFRIAPVDVALRFAFEPEPRKCFERIGRQLPFGAHAWTRFDRAFYEPYLLRQGLGSEVRVRSSPEARAWGDLETGVTRLCRGVVKG